MRFRFHDFILALLAFLVAVPSSAAADQPANRPNVIVILADDLGYGDLGCYGQKIVKTPHLDKLAAEGIQFMQHYSGNTVCAPSRCSLMIGKHQGHAYIRGNSSNKENGEDGGQMPLKAEEVTITEILKEKGYKTGAFG